MNRPPSVASVIPELCVRLEVLLRGDEAQPRAEQRSRCALAHCTSANIDSHIGERIAQSADFEGAIGNNVPKSRVIKMSAMQPVASREIQAHCMRGNVCPAQERLHAWAGVKRPNVAALVVAEAVEQACSLREHVVEAIGSFNFAKWFIDCCREG